MFKLLVANACSLTAIIFAGLLAMNEKAGWGWFLVIALLLFVYYSSSDHKTEDEDE